MRSILKYFSFQRQPDGQPDNRSNLFEPLLLRAILLAISFFILVLDQISKYIARSLLAPYEQQQIFDFFSLMLVYNKGAAFSFLGDAGGWQRWLFSSIALIVSVAFIVMIVRLRQGERLMALGYAFLLGGALGNLWDRIAEGSVTDFVLLHYQQWHFPVFNLADCAITLGVGCWIIALFLQPPPARASS